MAIDFPNSPATNDTYTVGSRTWTWTGTNWELKAVAIPANSISTTELASDAVTQAKIADRAVGSAELKEITLNAQTTSYTPVLTDAQKIVTMSSSSALNFTIPTDASIAFQIGDQINILQLGTGQVTISAVTPATTSVVAQGSKLKTNGQYSMATAVKIAANSWVVVGNLAA